MRYACPTAEALLQHPGRVASRVGAATRLDIAALYPQQQGERRQPLSPNTLHLLSENTVFHGPIIQEDDPCTQRNRIRDSTS